MIVTVDFLVVRIHSLCASLHPATHLACCRLLVDVDVMAGIIQQLSFEHVVLSHLAATNRSMHGIVQMHVIRSYSAAKVALLRHPEGRVRKESLVALGRLGHPAQMHSCAVELLLKDEVHSVRRAAVWALGSLGEHAAPHVVAMAALLGDEDGRVRQTTVECLGRLGVHATPCTSTMAALLADWDRGVRRAAEEALGKLGLGACDRMVQTACSHTLLQTCATPRSLGMKMCVICCCLIWPLL